MLLSIVTKFDHGDWVMFRSVDSKPWRKGRIDAIHIHQSSAHRSDAFMIHYLVEPEEFIGMEHDEKESILECDSLIRMDQLRPKRKHRAVITAKDLSHTLRTFGIF